MQCLGRTKTLRRCKRSGNKWFCFSHRWQPFGAAFAGVSALGMFCGLYQDLLRPIFEHTKASNHVAQNVPKIALTLKNSSDREISVIARGDIVIWLPQGVDELRRISGRFDLIADRVGEDENLVRVQAGQEVAISAVIRTEIDTFALYSKGIGDLEFILNRQSEGILFSGAIPFSSARIESTRWIIDVASQENQVAATTRWDKAAMILNDLAVYRDVEPNESGFVRKEQFMTLLGSLDFSGDSELLSARDAAIKVIAEAPAAKTGLPENLQLTPEIVGVLDRLFILAKVRFHEAKEN